jgi:uncharacterized protein YjbJ (UPF0337 family)
MEDTMKSSIREKKEGKFHLVKGKVKEMAGKPTGNGKLEVTGIGQIDSRQRSGKVLSGQESFGYVERAHHTPACPWPRDCGCMTHNSQNSERHEVFGERKFNINY